MARQEDKKQPELVTERMDEGDVLAQQVKLCVESLLHVKQLCVSSPGPAAVQGGKMS